MVGSVTDFLLSAQDTLGEGVHLVWAWRKAGGKVEVRGASAAGVGGRAGRIGWGLSKEWIQPFRFGKSLANGKWP